MSNIEIDKSGNKLFGMITELLSLARQFVVANVNRAMVLTYFEIGRLIVQDEQKGKERAEYGKSTLKELSQRLTNGFGKGFSVRNLEQMRKFFVIYSKSQTLSADFENEKYATLLRKSETPFKLSWSHYLQLIKISNR